MIILDGSLFGSYCVDIGQTVPPPSIPSLFPSPISALAGLYSFILHLSLHYTHSWETRDYDDEGVAPVGGKGKDSVKRFWDNSKR